MKQDSMHDKDHGGKPKPRIHGCAVRPKGWVSESGVQCRNYAKSRENGDIGPVDPLESRVAVETIIDARNGRSPHQDHDSEIVQLVAEPLHFWAVIADDVVGCG